MPVKLPSTSPRLLYVQRIVVPLQFAGLGWLPTKWSPSSAVMTNSVLALVMPCAASWLKKVPNAAFSCASCDSYSAEPGPSPAPVVHESWRSVRW
jgi:hypothetical protein